MLTPMARKENNVIDLAARNKSARQVLVRQLFDEHAAALRLFFRGRLLPNDDIEDLVQDLFSRLLDVEGLAVKMSASTGSNRAFLLTMANNMIVDLQRKVMVRKDYDIQQKELEGERVNEQTPEVIVAAQRDLDFMKDVIMKMKPDWRRAFILNRFKSMSYKDIASQMEITVKQVENCIVQAMKRIRKAEQKLRRQGGIL